MPVLMDNSGVTSQGMGIERTGEVLLFDARRFTVLYKGTVACAGRAIEEILNGDAVSNPLVAASGEAVTYPVQAATSYSADIAPVLAGNYVSCHREGGVAPFAMYSHTMVQGWSPMIREVLMTRRMPPGHIGDFINDRLVDNEDIRNIIACIEAGAPKDDANDPLTELAWPQSRWAFG